MDRRQRQMCIRDRRCTTRQTDPWGMMLRGYGIALLIALWAPILTIAVYSFNAGSTLTVWQGWSARWYAAIPGNGPLTAAIGQSLWVAALSTMLAVVIGTLAGVAITRAGRPIRWSLTGLLLVVFVAPEIVTAIGLLMLYLQAGPVLADGTIRMAIAHSVPSTVIVAFVVAARLSSLDPNLLAAAADLGAAPLRVLRRIVLPVAAPAGAAAAVLASTFSLDDVVASSMVSNVGTTTLPVLIFSTLHTGLKGDAAAASTLVMVGTSLLVCLLAAMLARTGQARTFIAGLAGG